MQPGDIIVGPEVTVSTEQNIQATSESQFQNSNSFYDNPIPSTSGFVQRITTDKLHAIKFTPPIVKKIHKKKHVAVISSSENIHNRKNPPKPLKKKEKVKKRNLPMAKKKPRNFDEFVVLQTPTSSEMSLTEEPISTPESTPNNTPLKRPISKRKPNTALLTSSDEE